MPCEVNADLVPFVRWEKDRQPLELNARLFQLPSGALVISNASEGDAGLYRCLVENVGSSKSSDEAQLQIAPGKGKSRLRSNPVSFSRSSQPCARCARPPVHFIYGVVKQRPPRSAGGILQEINQISTRPPRRSLSLYVFLKVAQWTGGGEQMKLREEVRGGGLLLPDVVVIIVNWFL